MILIIIISQVKIQINSLKQNIQIQEISLTQMNHVLDEKDGVIEQLNKTLIESKRERSKRSNHCK